MANFDLAKHVAIGVLMWIGSPAEVQSESHAAQIRRIELSEVALAANPDIEGVSGAMLTGQFDAPGLYVARSTMTDGALFPPHVHSDQRMTHVVSGTMYLGEGETFDEKLLVAYPAGTVAVTPPGTYHFMSAKEGDFTVLEIGSGPSVTEFPVN